MAAAVVIRSWAASAALVLGCAAAASAQQPRTVLLLYSEQWQAPATTLLTQTLRESLASSPAVVVEAQYLDIVRFAGEAHDRALADWLHSRYSGRRLAVIVAIGVPASAFATRYGEHIWPAARIVHATVD